MAKARREFSPEFKREAVALLETSGRPLMQVAMEVGISPSMLRNWRAVVRNGAIRSSAAAPGVSPLPLPADQASQIARLKRDLDRTRMERDVMMAAQRQRPAEGLICHSDRGSQYASKAYAKQFAAMKAKSSMSRTACCYDNAPMQSFSHTLKVELVHQRRWPTREHARRDLFAYTEGYYNLRRFHSALGYSTPEQAEQQMA